MSININSSETLKFPELDFSKISTGWVHKLNKDKVITELERRNLLTTGVVLTTKTLNLFKGGIHYHRFSNYGE